MLKKKWLMAVLAALMYVVTANAQTDYTSLIVNPSFEQDTAKDGNTRG